MNSNSPHRFGGVMLACLALSLGACGGDDEKKSDSGDKPVKTEAKTTAAAGTGAAKRELLRLGATYNAAFNKFKSRLSEDVKANDLEGGKSDAAQFRTAVFDYDAGVREIDAGDSQAKVSSLLGKSRTVITDLDAVSQAQEVAAFNRLIKRVNADNQELIAANNDLVRALGG